MAEKAPNPSSMSEGRDLREDVCIVDVGSTTPFVILRSCESWKTMFGLGEESIGRSMDLIAGPWTNMARLHTLIQSGSTGSSESCLCLYNKKGDEILVSIRAGTIPDGTPAGAGVRLSIRLSDGIRHKLAVIDDGLAKLLLSVSDPFMICDVSTQFLSMFQYTQGQRAVLNKPMEILNAPVNKSQTLKEMLHRALGGMSQQETLYVCGAMGEPVLRKVIVTPVVCDGEVINLSMVFFAVTVPDMRARQSSSSYIDADMYDYARPNPTHLSNPPKSSPDVPPENKFKLLLQQATGLSYLGARPRVRVQLVLDRQKHHSRDVSDSRTPLWNETFDFVAESFPCTIDITLEDCNRTEANAFLGATQVVVSKPLDDFFVDDWFLLGGDAVTGKVRIACSQDPKTVHDISRGLQPFGKSKLAQPFALASQGQTVIQCTTKSEEHKKLLHEHAHIPLQVASVKSVLWDERGRINLHRKQSNGSCSSDASSNVDTHRALGLYISGPDAHCVWTREHSRNCSTDIPPELNSSYDSTTNSCYLSSLDLPWDLEAGSPSSHWHTHAPPSPLPSMFGSTLSVDLDDDLDVAENDVLSVSPRDFLHTPKHARQSSTPRHRHSSPTSHQIIHVLPTHIANLNTNGHSRRNATPTRHNPPMGCFTIKPSSASSSSSASETPRRHIHTRYTHTHTKNSISHSFINQSVWPHTQGISPNRSPCPNRSPLGERPPSPPLNVNPCAHHVAALYPLRQCAPRRYATYTDIMSEKYADIMHEKDARPSWCIDEGSLPQILDIDWDGVGPANHAD